MKKKTIFIILILVFPLHLFAASWYMDGTLATGSNNGTSWTNAWKNFGAIVWGSGGVVAGDTLYISGGTTSKTYTATSNAMLTIGASGTNDSTRITIRPGQDAGHNGVVILDGNNTYSNLIDGNNISYLTIDGSYGGEIHLKIQNTDAAMEMAAGAGKKLLYIEIESVENGIHLNGATDYELAYCYLHNVKKTWAIKGTGDVGTWDSKKVHHNTIHINRLANTGTGADGFQGSAGLSFYNNLVYGVVGTVIGEGHQDGVEAWADYVKIYNNIFLNFGWSGISIEGNGHHRVFNNLFMLIGTDIATGTAAITHTTSGTAASYSDVLFYSNTIVDCYTTYNAVQFDFGKAGGKIISGYEFKNNLIYNSGKPVGLGGNAIEFWTGNYTCGEGVIIDSNLINAGPHGGALVQCHGSSYSPTNTQTGVPSFVSYTERSATNDFRLSASDTAAKDYGATLGAPYNTDILGVSRPQGAAWDIGAYEFGAGSGGSATGLTIPGGVTIR
jgi:hypothetical protein